MLPMVFLSTCIAPLCVKEETLPPLAGAYICVSPCILGKLQLLIRLTKERFVGYTMYKRIATPTQRVSGFG